MSESLKICIDSNEASARREIVNYLRLVGCEVEIRRLSVCDYVVSDRCGVERKDVRDFVGSLKDGRLFSQAKEIAAAYDRPVLVLEGRLPSVFKRSRMRPASVYGAMASLTLDYGFSIIPTEAPESTAVLIHRLAYREQTEESRPLQLRSVRREMPPRQQQLFLLSGLPKIGSTLAEELLRHFDTPYRVFEEIARAEVAVSKSGKTRRLNGPLSEVRGLGPIIVENAQRLLTKSYVEQCDPRADR
ncbi:MAG: ERCC4 domain-containing protein [Candidatus Bathyarchaeia archaeon]